MDDILKQVLDMDKKAKKQIEQLQEYRRTSLAGLGAQKDKIFQEEKEKALASAQRHSDSQKTIGDKELNETIERGKKILETMNKNYAENADKWIENIVSRVTE